jgi:hypothetical protein
MITEKKKKLEREENEEDRREWLAKEIKKSRVKLRKGGDE